MMLQIFSNNADDDDGDDIVHMSAIKIWPTLRSFVIQKAINYDYFCLKF